MPNPPSDVAQRARDLLDRKIAQESSKKRPKSAAEASSDAFFSALVEGAFLLAAADDELSEDESATLGETIAYVTGEVLEPDEFMEMIDRFADALADAGLDGRLRAIASAIPDAPARREILSFAALVALCDHHLAPAEQDVLTKMATTFGIAPDEAKKIAADIEKSLALRVRRLGLDAL